MANNLYDTGAPKRIIVEQNVRVTHEVVARRPEASWCELEPKFQCVGGPHVFGKPCDECPLKTKTTVTITPEFQPVEERKRLK